MRSSDFLVSVVLVAANEEEEEEDRNKELGIYAIVMLILNLYIKNCPGLNEGFLLNVGAWLWGFVFI